MSDIEIFTDFVKKCGSQKKASEMLGVSNSAISMYLNGSMQIGPALRERLRSYGYYQEVQEDETLRAQDVELLQQLEMYEDAITILQDKVKKLKAKRKELAKVRGGQIYLAFDEERTQNVREAVEEYLSNLPSKINVEK